MGKNRSSNASQAPASAKKQAPTTPAVAAKPAAAASAAKPTPAPASNKKQAPTPAPASVKKAKIEEPSSEEEDEDEQEELDALMEGSDDEEDEEEDDDSSQFFEVPEYVYQPTYVSFQLPPNGNITVMGRSNAVVTLKSATLGYEVKAGSRSVLIASVNNAGPSDDCCEDEEDEDHEHDDDDEEKDEAEIENLVLGSMIPNVSENLVLDVTLEGDFMLNNVSDVNSMYIVALVEPTDDDEDEEIDSEDDDAEVFLGGEDDSEEDDSAEDEDKKLVSSLFSKPAATAAPKAVAAPKPAAAAAPAVTADKKAQHKEAKKDAKKDIALDKTTVDEVIAHVVSELKANKGTVKQTDMGSSVAKKFGKGVKQMGFEEKTLTKVLENHAKGKVVVSADSFKLPK
ncbi:hypothetical protein BASA81_008576 [Batrachochytrium salamandrivorans]|nr:hypothetical protein BASA81_008576 [Batrachochytrium salamandrivorans]